MDLRFPLVGAIVGALVGALYHWLNRSPRARAESDDALDPAQIERQAEQRRRVASFVERAARAMVAYSRMVDAANADDSRELERLFRALAAEEAAEQMAELDVDDRAVREAVRTFLRVHADIGARIEQRLAAGQTVQIGGELRLRAAELGKTVEELHRAAGRFAAPSGTGSS